MTFERPWVFSLLLLPLLFLFAQKKGYLRPVSFAVILGDWNSSLFSDESVFAKITYILSRLLFVVAFILLIVAAAGPQFAHSRNVYENNGLSVIFLLDVSPSMAATDMAGDETRLAVACNLIKAFSNARPGDAVGLAAAGSSATLLLPATLDRNVLIQRLESLSPGELGGGSALGDGIALCVSHLAGVQAQNGVIVLITDGESNAGSVSPQTAAAAASSCKISLHVIGTGTRGKVPVDYFDAETGKRYTGFLESSFDEPALHSLATSGGGSYFPAANAAALSSVFDTISMMHNSRPPLYTVQDMTDIGTPFIIAALICFALSWILRRLCAGGVI